MQMPMEVFRDKRAMRAWTRAQKAQGKSVALVPTMGYLHEGHLSLVRHARTLCDAVVVSIYVNPSQFGPNEDLDRYPRDLQGDVSKLEPLNVSAVFCPSNLYDYSNVAPDTTSAAAVAAEAVAAAAGEHETWVTVTNLERPLCGGGRPGHFRGVATVVCKLFHIVEPDVAVFGRKDYQQLRIIQTMVRDLDFAVQVVGAPLLREPDGLAMSSRNVRLSSLERQQALSISRALLTAKQMLETTTTNNTTTTTTADSTMDADTNNGYASDATAVSSTNANSDAALHLASLAHTVRAEIAAAGGRVEYVEVVDAYTLQPITMSHDIAPTTCIFAPATNSEAATAPASAPTSASTAAPPTVLVAVAAHFGFVRLIDNVEIALPVGKRE